VRRQAWSIPSPPRPTLHTSRPISALRTEYSLPMIWVQALVCFAIWIGYGFVQSRRSQEIRAKLSALPRSRRVMSGAVLMLFGAATLFGVLMLVQIMGGLTQSGLTFLSWVLVAAGGLAFVHAQTMAMAMLITLVYDSVVTSEKAEASDHKGPDAA
jgi:hypothetical protein